MTLLPSYGSTISLFDPSPKNATQPVSEQHNSKLRDFLRHVRLLLPTTLLSHHFAWRSSSERRKVAAYQSRRMAALTSLLHLLPLGGAITLLALYWTKYWIGQAPDGLTALQFVAKFHEILMQASLVDILVYFIRAQALEGYIPLGALSGAAQASQISYLWSLDFLSAIWSPTFKMWRRVTFGLVVAAMLLMITAVGPSAAVLMIPRPNMQTVSATESRFLNMSETSLYPVAFGNQSILDTTETNSSANIYFAGIEEIEDYDHDSNVTAYMIGREAGSVIMYNMNLPQFSKQSNTETAVGTVATWLSYDILTLRETCGNCDRLFSLPTRNVKALVAWLPQPFVVASCTHLPAPGDEDIYSMIDKNKKLLEKPRSLYEQLLILTKKAPKVGDQIPVSWSPAAEDPHTLVSMNLHKMPIDGMDWNACTICTVSAFWRTTKTTLEKKAGLYRIRPEMPKDFRNIPKKDLTPIALSPNPSHSSNYSLPYLSTLDLHHYLAQYITFALAKIPERAFYVAQESSPDKADKGLGGFPSTELQDISKATPYRIETVKEGFGYGTRDRSAQLSVAVITAYCLITLLYIGYIAITGHASIAWTSPTELIMLALQSKEPSNIGHVSVGIDSMETLRRNVGIRVSTVDIGDTGEIRERLELVFEDDEDTERRDLTKVVRGTAY